MKGNSLAVQWLGLGAFTAGAQGSIPGWGTKIPHDAQHSQTEKKKQQKKEPQDQRYFHLLRVAFG